MCDCCSGREQGVGEGFWMVKQHRWMDGVWMRKTSTVIKEGTMIVAELLKMGLKSGQEVSVCWLGWNMGYVDE